MHLLVVSLVTTGKVVLAANGTDGWILFASDVCEMKFTNLYLLT